MPTQTVIVLAGIVLVFVVFAASLVWVDHYSRGARHLEPGE